MTRYANHARQLFVLMLLAALGASAAPLTHVISHQDNTIVIDIATGGATLTERDGNILPEMDECISFSASGAPMLPTKTFTLALPPNADPGSVSVAVTDLETETVALPTGKRVQPGPALGHWDGTKTVVQWDHPDKMVDGFDMTYYGADVLYPAQNAIGGASGHMRKWGVGTVAFYPVRYNPVTGSLEVVRSATVTVSYAVAKADLPAELMGDTAMDREAALLFENFDQAAGWYPQGGQKSADGYDYVIITTNTILSKTRCLASLETQHEPAHTVLTVTEDKRYENLNGSPVTGGWGGGTGDTAAENLRNWLKSNYAAMGIKYVLIAGNPHPNTGDLAMKWTHFRDDLENPDSVLNAATDTYFGELTGNWNLDGDQYYGELIDDVGPGGLETALELVVGRIPVYSTDAAGIATLESIVNKTIAYANADAGGDLAWRKKLLLPLQRLDDTTTGTPVMEKIRTDYAIPAGMSTYRIYGEDFGKSPELTPCSYDNVETEWKKGYGMVVWCTHGSKTHAADVFINSQCAELDNSKPSFVFELSCLNGQPEYASNLGYSLLKNGAVATIAGTEVTMYWIGDGAFMRSMGNASVAQHYAKNIINGLPAGDALRQAKTDSRIAELFALHPNFGNGQKAGWPNFLAFTLYGDPAVSLYDNGAGTPSVAVNPNPINLYSALAHGMADRTIRVFPTGPGSLSYTVTDDAAWLTVSPSVGSTSGEMDVLTLHADTASKAVGVYNATITVTAPGAPNSPLAVPVKLTIAAADPNPPSIGCDISSLVVNVSVTEGGNTLRRDFDVYANGEGMLYCNIAQGAAPVSWLSLNPDSGAVHGTERLTVGAMFNTASLPVGTHTASIVITGSQTPSPPNAPLVIPVTVHVSPPIDEALDTPGWDWVSSGSVPWTSTALSTTDGVDAAISGDGNGQNGTGSLSTTVQGPCRISFFWKLAAVGVTNRLNFLIDGNVQASLSSTKQWALVTKDVPDGLHTVEWTYGGLFSSTNFVGLDQVAVTPYTEPYMVVNPKRIIAKAKPGDPALLVPLTVENIGVGTFNLTATESRPELSLANASGTVGTEPHTVDLVFDIPALSTGTYSGTVTVEGEGAVNGTVMVPYELLVYNGVISLAEALDAPGLNWAVGPGSDTMWQGGSTSTHDGVDAGMVVLGNGAVKASLKTTVQGPGHLGFAWLAVSATAECAYTFAVDNAVVRGPLSVGGAYQVEEVDLLPGSHELVWTATRTAGAAPGFFLDEVAYEQYMPEIALSVTEITAACQPGRRPAAQSFEIWNAGTGPLEYQIESDSSWVNVLPDSGTSQGEHDMVTVNFLANRMGMGVYTANITVSTIGTAAGAGALSAVIPVTLEVGTKNVLSLEAAADNTLYDDAAGAKSNGAGPTIIVHKSPLTAERRGLLRFDVQGGLPSQAVITDAKLEMTVLGVESNNALSVVLRRVTKGWGEGISNAAIPDDLTGAASTTGDATWLHTLYHSSSWATAGGDYSATTTATQSVARAGACVWGVTPQLLADVQSWHTTPGGNYGWVLLPASSLTAGWKRFASSEHATAAERPRLTVTFYTSAPATAIVPNLIGKSQANADAAIVDASLVVGTVTEASSATVPAGFVISQDPAPATAVLIDSLVDMTVSTGPAPVIVPDMRGMSSSAVADALSAAGLVKGGESSTPSLYSAGLLAAHSPAAGAQVPPGSAVSLVYSTGAGLVEVPDLDGAAEPDLKQILADAWLSEGLRTYENSDKVAPGLVISQNPPAGDRVMTNTEIAVVVSIGPRFVRVPDLGWSTEAEASARLATETLVKGTVGTVVSFSVPAGRVVSQNPVAEIMVPENTAVSIVLSIAPTSVVVPDLAGLKQTDAEDLLGSVLLSRGTVTTAYSDTVPAGVVISQNPVAGASVAPGSSVAMTVSSGPRPITGSIVINSDRSATNTRAVTLALTWGGGAGAGVSRMRFSNDGSTWTAWEALAATRAYTLPAGEEHKTVRVQYIDKLNNRSDVYSDYIRLDTTLPAGTIIINNGAATTTTLSVALKMTWSDTGCGVTRMRFSDNGSTWTSWIPQKATRNHTLPAGLGNHTVRVQFLDGANNYSVVSSDYIKVVAP